MAPILATPHAALAIGFAFLILPSGWIVRWVSPEVTGWVRPPQLVTVRDPLGLALIAGLMVKEIPYLVLMMIGALNQLAHREAIAVARALGYSPAKAWLCVVFPQIYRQIRLPVYAVLAFSASVVDVALVLGPGAPPPLAVQAMRWFMDYDLNLYPQAAAAGILQFMLTLGLMLLWRIFEWLAALAGRAWIRLGQRETLAAYVLGLGAGMTILLALAAFFSIASLVVWSFAGDWRFPDALPVTLTDEIWRHQASSLARPAFATLAIGFIATVTAVALVLACLEQEARAGSRTPVRMMRWLYVPLLVPQIAFLFGLQVLLVRLNVDGHVLTVAFAHLVFVLPYAYLSLKDPYRALDPRYERSAAALGASPARVFWRVKFPILLRPVLIASAVGFAVSVGQYLPTLFVGAGRIATLTTEAVTLSSGGDRRVLGVYGVLQAAFPLLAYAAALAIPAMLYRHRKGLA